MASRGALLRAAAAPPLAVSGSGGARALSSDSEDRDGSSSASPGFPPRSGGDGAASPDSPLGSPLASPRLDKPHALATLAAQLDAVASAAARSAGPAVAEASANARELPPRDDADHFASLESSLRSDSPAAVSACSSPAGAMEDASEEVFAAPREGARGLDHGAEALRRARASASAAAAPTGAGLLLPWQQPRALGVGLAGRFADDDESYDEHGADADAERERVSAASTPSAASKQRAVAEWVESTSPLTQPRLRGGMGAGSLAGAHGESPPWGDAWGADGDGDGDGGRHAPASPAAWAQRESLSPRSPRASRLRSPARRRGSRERGALSLAEGDAAAALGRLLDDVADVKRALLSPPSADDTAALRRSPPPAAAASPPSPRVRASPDRPGVLPPEAWLSARRATPPTPEQAPLAPMGTPSPRSSTRRSALLLQLDGTCEGAELEAFSFPADRNRPASPELWRPGDPPSPATQHAPPRLQPRPGRAASVQSDTEASAPSEMARYACQRALCARVPGFCIIRHSHNTVETAQGSEMDSFRLGGRRAQASRPAAPSGFGSALLAEERGGGGTSDWWAQTIPEEEEAFDGAQPGSVLWEQRRAALAERRVVALEQALEDAVSAAEESGWEREALLVRTTEAEAAAASATARADAAAGRAAAELQSAEYVRRLLSRAEQVRDAARSDVRQLRARLTARDGELRAALDALDVRDEEAVTLRTRLRGERARAAALDLARAEAQAALDAAYARSLLLHRVLGMALAACVLMALRLMLGARAGAAF